MMADTASPAPGSDGNDATNVTGSTAGGIEAGASHR
jgi:hypothetical protein